MGTIGVRLVVSRPVPSLNSAWLWNLIMCYADFLNLDLNFTPTNQTSKRDVELVFDAAYRAFD